MGLPPLEYSDCFLDSPLFREIIALYEQELETNTRLVKNLVRECDNMIQKTEEFSKVQQSFGHALSQFKFQTIGTEQTEDEQLIGVAYLLLLLVLVLVLLLLLLLLFSWFSTVVCSFNVKH
jgi:Rho GTPase-activating protein 10